MTKILGTTIHKILSKICQPKRGHRGLSLFRKTKTNEKLCHYIFVRANKNDYDDIIKLMHEAYYPDEPTCYCLGITHNPILDESTVNAIAEGVSMIARCKYDGKLVGACINESAHPWDPDLKEKFACSVRCPKVKRLLLFYAHMQRVPDVWNRCCVQKVFEMSNVFVKKNHRRRGIALKLLQDSRAIGTDCGYRVIRCDATSEYTAKLCKRIGMDKIAEIPYCSYLDNEKLQPIFRPAHPHQAVKIYVEVDPQKRKAD